MRSVDRLIRFRLPRRGVRSAGRMRDVRDKAAAPAAGAPTEAKAAPATATGKEAAAAAAKPETPPISPAAQRAFDAARQA